MARKASLLLLLLLLALPTMAWGHAEYKEASPGKGELVTTEISEINLTFSTDIEALSTLELLDSNGNAVKGEVTAAGDKLHAEFAAPLPSGNYTVNWRTLGVDGHVLHGDYTFTVELPAPPAETAPEPGSDDAAGTGDGSANGTGDGAEGGAGSNGAEGGAGNATGNGGSVSGGADDAAGSPPAEAPGEQAPANGQPAETDATGNNQGDSGTEAAAPADERSSGNTFIYVLIGVAVIAIVAGFGIKARRRQGKR